MTLKKLSYGCLFALWLLIAAPAQAEVGQTLQISTHFSYVFGKPSWLLILRDISTGEVLPYLYDIQENDNSWVAFSNTRTYSITASTLKFGKFAVINNFCQLEEKIISGKSMFITLTGALTPDKNSFQCHVTKFKT